MRIESLSIKDMWSFADKPAVFEDFGQCNVIIGKNNSGKSNVGRALLLLKKQAQWLTGSPAVFQVAQGEAHDYGESEQKPIPVVEFVCSLDDRDVEETLTPLNIDQQESAWRKSVGGVLRGGFKIRMDAKLDVAHAAVHRFAFADGAGANRVFTSGHHDSPAKGGKLSSQVESLRKTITDEICGRLSKQLVPLSGWRNLKQPTSFGPDLVKALHSWKAPAPGETPRRRQFDRIQRLLQDLTGMPELALEPQADGSQLNTLWRDRYLPISAFGDGIQHLLMMAVEFATRKDYIFIIEEPETHLHPELQRGLMEIIRDNNDNQYFLTTHSPVLLDAGKADAVFRIDHDGDASSVKKCEEIADLYEVLDDLGVRASDILQANLVIWVEGPTDRMFLKRCFELRESPFVEGTDYVFAYYGGSLRRHVTFDEDNALGKTSDEDKSLVNLMRLSRNVIMVCDSDRDSEGGDLGETKERLKRECEEIGGLYWVTQGREIENYLSTRVLTAAFTKLLETDVKIALPKYARLGDQLKQNCGEVEKGKGWIVDYGHNKVKTMREILKHLAAEDLGELDLSARLDDVVQKIKGANAASNR